MNNAVEKEQEEGLEEQVEAANEDGQESTEESSQEGGEQEKTPEERARLLGWSPKDDYKGDPDKWVDAETYIEDAENDYRRMRKVNKVLERKLDKQEKSIEAILAYQTRQVEDAEKQAYERGVLEVEERYKKAVEDGDVEAAEQAWKDRDNIKPPTASDDTIVQAWIAKTSWYNKDMAMTAAAQAKEGELYERGLPLKQRLEAVDAFIQEEFPHKFEARKPKLAPTMVNGRGNNVNRKTKIKPGSYEALTDEARRECDWTVKGSNGKITKEKWLRYAEPHMFKQI